MVVVRRRGRVGGYFHAGYFVCRPFSRVGLFSCVGLFLRVGLFFMCRPFFNLSAFLYVGLFSLSAFSCVGLLGVGLFVCRPFRCRPFHTDTNFRALKSDPRSETSPYNSDFTICSKTSNNCRLCSLKPSQSEIKSEKLA